MRSLPHRYPMLLIDRVLEFEYRTKAVVIKNVTMNEPFFQGHYPGMPIMPGVLMIEAMAQAGGVMFLDPDDSENLVPVIGAIDKVRFRKQVVPGDQLRIEVNVLKVKGPIGKMEAKATVDGDVAAEMELTFKLIEAN